MLRSVRLLAVALFVSLATPALAQTVTQPQPTVVDVPVVDAGQKADLLKFISGDHALGDPKAPVTLIEYASLSCSHCAYFSKEVFPKLKGKYVDTGKVFFIFRHFPLNEPALRGAMLADCSGDKFFAFTKAMFETQENWAFVSNPDNALRMLANVGGIGDDAFTKCMADKKLEDAIVSGTKWASEGLDVKSTPTLFVGGERVDGARSFEDISKLIDAHLASNKK